MLRQLKGLAVEIAVEKNPSICWCLLLKINLELGGFIMFEMQTLILVTSSLLFSVVIIDLLIL